MFKYPKAVFTFCSIFLFSMLCPAQSMDQFYQQELHRIAKKAYLLGLSGKVNAYTNDSLASIFSLEDRKNRGAEIIVKQIVGADGDWKDSTIMQFFNPESVAGDLGVYFKITTQPNGSVLFMPFAVAPVFTKNMHAIQLSVPLFCLKWTDFLSQLDKDEKAFFLKYIPWRQMGISSSNSENEISECEINWNNYVGMGLKNYYSLAPSKAFANAIYQLTKEQLFRSFYSQHQLSLKEVWGKNISIAEFTKKHKQEITTGLSLKSWGNFDHYWDTTYSILPEKFDSLACSLGPKEIIWKVQMFKKNTDTNNKTVQSEYTISDAEAKKALHPDLYFFYTYYAKYQKN